MLALEHRDLHAEGVEGALLSHRQDLVGDVREFWDGTDWGYWESRQDPLCSDCLMHSGFEASVVKELPRHPGDMVRLFAWNFGVAA